MAAVSVPVYGEVTSGSSSAEDISGTATVTGTLLGNNLGILSVLVTPINSAEGTAPNPYNLTPSLLNTKSSGTGIVTLGLGVAVDSLNAKSDVDALEGNRSASASSGITSASANLDLSLGGILGAVNLFTIGLTSGNDVITSNSGVLSDGFNASPSAGSNLISSLSQVTVSVLGVNVIIPSLLPGVTAPVGINVNVGLLTVTGTISLTADDLDTVTGAGIGFANGTSLSVVSNLSLNATGGLAAINVTSNVDINKTTAQLTAVPEPGYTVTLSLALGSLLLRRRR